MLFQQIGIPMKKDQPTIPAGPYCYALADQNGVIFYIGKGYGRRMFHHEQSARRGKTGAKADYIRSILAGGHQIQYRILGEYETEAEAYQAERAFIAGTPGLVNIRPGGSGAQRITAKERIQRHASHLLAHLAPFETWVLGLPDEIRTLICRIDHSPETIYRAIANELLGQILNPAPTTLRVRADGAVIEGWG